jgi:hypothetical protein
MIEAIDSVKAKVRGIDFPHAILPSPAPLLSDSLTWDIAQ